MRFALDIFGDGTKGGLLSAGLAGSAARDPYAYGAFPDLMKQAGLERGLIGSLGLEYGPEAFGLPGWDSFG